MELKLWRKRMIDFNTFISVEVAILIAYITICIPLIKSIKVYKIDLDKDHSIRSKLSLTKKLFLITNIIFLIIFLPLLFYITIFL